MNDINTKTWSQIRHGILEHIEDGRIRLTEEWPIYSILHLLANINTGVVESVSSVYIAKKYSVPVSYVQRMMANLEVKKYIKRYMHRGTRRPFAVVINKFKTASGTTIFSDKADFNISRPFGQNRVWVLLEKKKKSLQSISQLKGGRTMDGKEKQKPPAFIINGQSIAGSFWGRVVKRCGGDKYAAGECFYRARNAENIIKYIQDGLDTGTIFNPRIEEEGSSAAKVAWIEREILRLKKTPDPIVQVDKDPSSVRDTVSDIVSNIARAKSI